MTDYACVIHVYGIIGSSYEQDQKIAALNSSEMYLCFSLCCSLNLHQKEYTLCIFSDMISECSSRAIMYNSGSMEGISVETLGRHGNYKIVPLNFQWIFH